MTGPPVDNVDAPGSGAEIPKPGSEPASIDTPEAKPEPKMPDAESTAKKSDPTQPGALLRFWRWLRAPSHLLSVIAIIATVIVPLVDKWLKADETRRGEIEKLLDTTDKIITASGELQKSIDPNHPFSDNASGGMLAARRAEYVSYAFEIAHRIHAHVEPPILIILSDELIRDNRQDDARILLNDLIKRRNITPYEKFQAHMLLAACFAWVGKGRTLSDGEMTSYRNELSNALAPYPDARSDDGLEVRVEFIRGISSFEMEMHDTSNAAIHDSQWQTLQAQLMARASGRVPANFTSTPSNNIAPPFATNMSSPIAPPSPQPGSSVVPLGSYSTAEVSPTPLDARSLPQSRIFNIYYIKFGDGLDRSEVLIKMPGEDFSEGSADDIVYVYQKQKFLEAWTLLSQKVSQDTNTPDTTGLIFGWGLEPQPGRSSKQTNIARWVLDLQSNGLFTGTELESSHPPAHFTGSPSPRP